MYKDRRRAWGISKNVKSEEMEAIIRKTAQRLRAGKKSYFQLRKTWVSNAKIKRYRKDKKIQSEQQAMDLRARTPPELICYTPLASPMSTPRELEIPERLVKVVHEYITGSFDSSSWLVDGLDWCWHKNGIARAADESIIQTFNYRIFNAAELLAEGQSKPAWQSLHIAMSLVGEVVSAEDPQTLFGLVNAVLSLFIAYQLPDVALTVLRHFHNMGTKLVGEMHPLSQSSRFIKDLLASKNMEALLKLSQVGIDDFTARVGGLSRDAVQLQLSHIQWSSELQHDFDSTGKLQALLQPLRDSDLAGQAGLGIQLRLAKELRYAGRFQEAFEVCERLAKLTLDTEDANLSAWYVGKALHQMSRCHEESGDVASAERSIRQAINFGRTHFGTEHDSVLSLLTEHEYLLKKCDALDEAMQVREYHEMLVASKYERIRQAEEEEWQEFQALEGGESVSTLSY